MGHRPITGTACCLAARQTALTPPGTLTDPSGKSDLTVIRGWHFSKTIYHQECTFEIVLTPLPGIMTF